MFGASNTGSSLFGQQKPATTGFGAPAAAPATSGFSFGNNNAASNTTTAPSTGGLFGAKPAAASGGLFGASSSAAAPAPAAGSSGFSFGANSAATPATGGLFGASTNNNTATAAPSTGGLFGGNTNTSSGGLFGAQPAAPATGGLFGNNAASTQPATGGLFGASNNTAQQQQGTSLFGSNQNTLQQQQQQQQPQQQIGFTNNTSSQPAFAWSQQNSNQSQPQQQQQQQQQPLSFLSNSQQQSSINGNNNNSNTNNSKYAANIQEQLTKVKNSWDPTSQQTVLKTFFYNTVPENQTALYTKPINEDDEWDHAFENKPTNNSIPVRAVGFEDLQKRAQTQVNHVAQSRNILQQISEKYKVLSDKHELDTASRIVAAKAKHTRISRRILRLVSTLAVLKSKGYQLSPSEEKLVESFQELLEKSQDPSGLGKTNELWARLAILKEKAKSLGEQLDNSLGIKNTEGGSDELNDGEQTQQQVVEIAKVLKEQQTGIKYLNEVLEANKKTLEKLIK